MGLREGGGSGDNRGDSSGMVLLLAGRRAEGAGWEGWDCNDHKKCRATGKIALGDELRVAGVLGVWGGAA